MLNAKRRCLKFASRKSYANVVKIYNDLHKRLIKEMNENMSGLDCD